MHSLEGLRWNHDRSVTMQLSLFDGKENVEPPAVTHRNEAFLMINSPPPKPAIKSRSSSFSETARSFGNEQGQRLQPDVAAGNAQHVFGPLPPEIIKIITPNSDTDKIPEELINTNKSKK